MRAKANATPADKRRSRESLLSPAALGGVLARKGMRFQDLWLLHRLVGWVVDVLFRGFVNEGREDVDSFRYVDESRKEFVVHRWQLKDRLVTKSLLAEVLAGFEAQNQGRAARGAAPVASFNLVSPAAHEDVWTLPDSIERVRNARPYGENSIEYLETLDDLTTRLRRLGVLADASFVSERVYLDFRAGWAEPSKHYWDTLQALLQALGVDQDLARDAANHLFVIVSGDVSKLVERQTIIESLARFQRQPTRSTPAAPVAARTREQPQAIEMPSLGPGSHCLVSYFPDDAVLLRFPDGTRGLIDCGPTAVRHVVAYLAARSIDKLSFLALSHWHHDQYGGVPALLNAVSRIERVWLKLDADPRSAVARRFDRQRREMFLFAGMDHTARTVVDLLIQRMQRDKTHLYYTTGLQWMYRAGRGARSDDMCIFAPESDEYLSRPNTEHDLSACFLVRVAGRQLLIGGHAHRRRWRFLLEAARAGKVTISADGFFLPHYAARDTLTPALIKGLVNPESFVALLPVNEAVRQRWPNITDPAVLNAVRAAHGRVVVCDSSAPTHFVMNREGLFQALSPALEQRLR